MLILELPFAVAFDKQLQLKKTGYTINSLNKTLFSYLQKFLYFSKEKIFKIYGSLSLNTGSVGRKPPKLVVRYKRGHRKQDASEMATYYIKKIVFHF